jgi:hypothetical protein
MLRNLKVHDSQKSTTRSLSAPHIYNLTYYFLEIYFNITLPPTQKSRKSILPVYFLFDLIAFIILRERVHITKLLVKHMLWFSGL